MATRCRAVLALATAALATACSSVLGLKDPTLDEVEPMPDAAVDAPIDTGPAACMPSACPFGCDSSTNACRDGKLWVFLSTGSYLGNGFGGTDAPPTVRATTDALCHATATASHASRACNRTRTHAVLLISAADSIALMATQYGIPTAVPVHRADDDVLVANTWNDLIDTTRPPRAPIANAPSEQAGIVWTGANGTSTCVNWTSSASTDNGVRGHPTLTSANWMIRSSNTCNLLARLLCVCWSGGD